MFFVGGIVRREHSCGGEDVSLSTEGLDKELDSSLDTPPRITAEAVGGARASGKILADGRGEGIDAELETRLRCVAAEA